LQRIEEGSHENSSFGESKGIQCGDGWMVYGSQAEHLVSGVAASEEPYRSWIAEAANRARCFGCRQWSGEGWAMGGARAEGGGSKSDAIGFGDLWCARDHVGDALVDHASMRMKWRAVTEICFLSLVVPSDWLHSRRSRYRRARMCFERMLSLNAFSR